MSIFRENFLEEGFISDIKKNWQEEKQLKKEINKAISDGDFDKAEKLIKDNKSKFTSSEYSAYLAKLGYAASKSNKKKDKPKLDNTAKEPTITREEAEEIAKVVKDRVKFYINKFNKDPKVKQTMKDLIEKGIKEYGEDETDDIRKGIPKLKYEIFEDGMGRNSKTGRVWYETIFEIFDLSQIERIIISDIIYDLADELRNDSELKKLDEFKRISFDCGDGDEGCLYVTIDMY